MPLAAAGIGAAGSLLGGITGGKAAKKAARIQAQATQAGIDEQKNEFNTVQANEAPYMAAGKQGLGGYLDLLGLNGNGAQGSAIDALKGSPAFTSLYNTGQDTILQDAAATGGLRGGNTQNSLANFGSSLLAQVIQSQLGNLGGLVSTGQAGASGSNSAALSTGDNISTLLGQQGRANASGVLGGAIAGTSTINDLSKLLQSALGGGSINNGITQSALSGIGSLSSVNPSAYVLADTAPSIPGLF